MPPESKVIRQTRRHLLRQELARQGGSRAIAGCSSAGNSQPLALQWRAPCQVGPYLARVREERNAMHPEDLMKPDLFSEIVVLGSSTLIFASLLLVIVTALTQA